MKTPAAFPGRLTPACIALVLGCSLAVALGTWVALSTPANDHPAVTLAGRTPALSDCIARKIGLDPRLEAETPTGAPRARVTVLAGAAEEKPTRVVYEGAARLNFVVTVTPTGADSAEARLTTLPRFNPAPIVDKIIRSCAGR